METMLASEFDLASLVSPEHTGRYAIYNGDSRIVLGSFPSESFDCVITSPPYGDLKDYGDERQIGFGQDNSNEYFEDLSLVFKHLFRICKPGGAVWVIADNLKRKNRLLPLPWLIATEAENNGFMLQDIIVWDKGKSLPWSHQGRFRSQSEHIVLLSKGNMKTYNINRVRQSEGLSQYWVRYPERYHPLGSAPSDIWHFPIPVQGSWNSSMARHYCPLPPQLVKRMVLLSTEKGDNVLDPFSGIGTVPAVSAYLERNGVGIEINSDYISQSTDKAASVISEELSDSSGEGESGLEQANTIAKLRIHKYAKLLLSKYQQWKNLHVQEAPQIKAIVVEDYYINLENEDGIWASAYFSVLPEEGGDVALALSALQRKQKERPLSKFGLSVDIFGETQEASNDDRSFYFYRPSRFNEAIAGFSLKRCDLLDKFLDIETSGQSMILSPIYLAIPRPIDG